MNLSTAAASIVRARVSRGGGFRYDEELVIEEFEETMAIIPQGSNRLIFKLPEATSASALLTDIRTRTSLASDASSHRTIGLAKRGFQWHFVQKPAVAQHPWDAAHEFSRRASELGYRVYAEPDLLQAFEGFSSYAEATEASDPDDHWPPDKSAPLDWHLNDDHSQLKTARNLVGDPGGARRVRIGHLDTG